MVLLTGPHLAWPSTTAAATLTCAWEAHRVWLNHDHSLLRQNTTRLPQGPGHDHGHHVRLPVSYCGVVLTGAQQQHMQLPVLQGIQMTWDVAATPCLAGYTPCVTW